MNATDDDKSIQRIQAVIQVNDFEDDDEEEEEEDEDISALISAQDTTLDDSLTSLPCDTTQFETSRTEISSPRSDRYGSYDVNPSIPSPVSFDHDDHDQVPSPTWHISPPVFTPPPPPDSPPPSSRNSAIYREKQTDTESTILYNHRDPVSTQTEEEEGWREWLTLDNDNVDIIDPPDMEDRCVGTTPRDSMSVISSRTVSSVSTVRYLNRQGENQDDSINNNNNEVEHIFHNGEINHVAQSPSSITSACSSPIRCIAAVSPTRDSEFSLPNNNVADSSMDKTPLQRSPSRSSVSSITSFRSAMQAHRSARLNANASQQSPSRVSISSANSYTSSSSVPKSKYSDSTSSNAAPVQRSVQSNINRRQHPSNKNSNATENQESPSRNSSTLSSQQSPSRNSISSVNSYTSSSTVSRSRYSDSTVSPSRAYTIGFPFGGFGSNTRVNDLHLENDDENESDTEIEAPGIPYHQSPIQNPIYQESYGAEVYEGEDIIMVVLSKESKSLGK